MQSKEILYKAITQKTQELNSILSTEKELNQYEILKLSKELDVIINYWYTANGRKCSSAQEEK